MADLENFQDSWQTLEKDRLDDTNVSGDSDRGTLSASNWMGLEALFCDRLDHTFNLLWTCVHAHHYQHISLFSRLLAPVSTGFDASAVS